MRSEKKKKKKWHKSFNFKLLSLRGALSVEMKQSKEENGNLQTFVSKIIYPMYYKVYKYYTL